MPTTSPLFFDKQDYELLYLVNHILERDQHRERERDRDQQLFDSDLHPHGIKELAVSRELRVAYAVINLLESLEAGASADRILALHSLHDEVLHSAQSTFRRNTGRVLIQIMKDLVRAYGDFERQLRLAHDFREAATGKRRVVRDMLRRYHLLEMPEAWDQLTFDNHVHDSNTKGRKTPTHLIMDAWIKGIRSLTVIYYNFVETGAVQELMEAAVIMGINIRVGVEFKARFRGRYIEFIWEPVGLTDVQSMLAFLQEDSVCQLMAEGRKASAYSSKYVLGMLEQYNAVHRHDISDVFGVALREMSEKEFMTFVAAGQPSLLHLAELVYKQMLPAMLGRLPELRTAYEQATPEEQTAIEAMVQRMQDLHPEEIMETWFTVECNPTLPSPHIPPDDPDLPELLRLDHKELVERLVETRSYSRVTLTLSALSPEDVLELLYNCEGKISHLEMFNLKDYAAGRMPHGAAISTMQLAINQGSAIALKRLIRGMIKEYGESNASDVEERTARLTEVLRNISKLQRYYKHTPLKTRMGSDSTSRSYRLYGMGFVFFETLPATAQRNIKDPKNFMRQVIPLRSVIDSRFVYSPRQHYSEETERLYGVLRRVPGLRYLGYNVRHDWVVRPATTEYADTGTIATLGGIQRENTEHLKLAPKQSVAKKPGLSYLNTRVANTLKVLVGLTLATCTFMYTQQWWLLAYFGAVIWFAITGVRNILQAVLSGGGIRSTPLLRWNDYVSWSRLCDSLLYTGISVPLLELILRWFVLGKLFSVTATSSPVLFFTIISTANGLYIAAHNIYRGFPKEAVIGNLFRSVLAIPISLVYNIIFLMALDALGTENALGLAQQASAIISKTASDTVAAMIEGLADKSLNMRMRYWDYTHKLQQLFSCFSRLEVLLPEEDVLEALQRPNDYLRSRGAEVAELEKAILIHSLDLMYFWMYQPRARTTFARMINAMSKEEKNILARSQQVLSREREVSQLFVDGIVGKNFARPLAFFLDRYKEYLQDMAQLTREPLQSTF